MFNSIYVNKKIQDPVTFFIELRERQGKVEIIASLVERKPSMIDHLAGFAQLQNNNSCHKEHVVDCETSINTMINPINAALHCFLALHTLGQLPEKRFQFHHVTQMPDMHYVLQTARDIGQAHGEILKESREKADRAASAVETSMSHGNA